MPVPQSQYPYTPTVRSPEKPLPIKFKLNLAKYHKESLVSSCARGWETTCLQAGSGVVIAAPVFDQSIVIQVFSHSKDSHFRSQRHLGLIPKGFAPRGPRGIPPCASSSVVKKSPLSTPCRQHGPGPYPFAVVHSLFTDVVFVCRRLVVISWNSGAPTERRL